VRGFFGFEFAGEAGQAELFAADGRGNIATGGVQ
jgi:hypothetical protein